MHGLRAEVLLEARLDRSVHGDDRPLAGDRDLTRKDKDRCALGPAGMNVAAGALDGWRQAILVHDTLPEEEAALEGVETLDEHLSNQRRPKQAQRQR
jgi:hypothetical protein